MSQPAADAAGAEAATATAAAAPAYIRVRTSYPRSFKLSSRSCKDLLLSFSLSLGLPCQHRSQDKAYDLGPGLTALHQHVLFSAFQCISITEIFYKT